MVDGLDISAYYAYSAGWENPEPIEQPQSDTISFETVTVADTEQYRLSATGVSWDAHGYSLHLSAENSTDQAVSLNLGDVYLNGRKFGKEYALSLEPGESGSYRWHISWEAMAEYGIFAQTGEDILSVSFIFNPLYDGYLPTDENGNVVLNTDHTDIYPLGVDAVSQIPVQGTVVLETGQFKLYAIGFGQQTFSCLTTKKRPTEYTFSYVLENLSGNSMSYTVTDFRLDDATLNTIGASVVRGGSSCFSSVSIPLTDGSPEELTFTLTINNTDSYTVTVDLTRELEG